MTTYQRVTMTELKESDNINKKEAWFNTFVWLKNVDMVQEEFTARSFFNIYWMDNDFPVSDEDFDQKAIFQKYSGYQGRKTIDLLSLKESNSTMYEKILINSPIYNFLTKSWFFQNAVTEPNIFKLSLSDCNAKNSDKIWMIEILFEGIFRETFEVYNFPFDAQFLNIKFKLDIMNYEFKSIPPKHWLNDNNISWNKNYQIDIPILSWIFEPADKEWMLLPPWIDLRVNSKTKYNLIRLRVVRKPRHYILYNLIPILLITGLSFISVALDTVTDKILFLVTLVLTIAAGRSELVPEMARASNTSLIDYSIFIAYIIFTIMMIGISIDGDNDIDDQNMWIWIICGIIWFIIGILPLIWFAFKWRCCLNNSWWEKRAEREMKSWAQENDYINHLTGDSVYTFGSDQTYEPVTNSNIDNNQKI